ncbi:MAG: hypothetical protein J5842_06425, partial [Lachnospiraceae bacterium]|nr:hypothetical protein [Lachnospiraceae bacterium]
MKEKSIPKPYLGLGALLNEGRYRIDGLLSDNDLVTGYAGYDIFRKKDVVIRELFPTAIVQRAPGDDQGISVKLLSDEVLFSSMKAHMIARAKKLISLYPIENAAGILSFFEENGTVYVIEETMEGLMTLDGYLKKRHSAK